MHPAVPAGPTPSFASTPSASSSASTARIRRAIKSSSDLAAAHSPEQPFSRARFKLIASTYTRKPETPQTDRVGVQAVEGKTPFQDRAAEIDGGSDAALS